MTPIIRGATLAFIAAGLAGSLYAQSFIDLGSSGPAPGPNDISQLSTSGDTTWLDGLNYFSYYNPSVLQSALGGV